MSPAIHHWSAAETAKRCRQREVSVAEVAQAHLARMAAINPQLNAVVQEADDVMAQARAMDAQGPRADQPLWGVPITIKINVDQIGTANSNGVQALANNFANDDAPVVRHLKQAGALTIGRTNTPEFSMRWFTSNELHGVTRNPWDFGKTPGGSSGGAAAAVASGIGCLAHGNDLGGSLRYPAFCCGVTSIRPSRGRVPAFAPSSPKERPALTQSMSVQGPIARTVADLRLALGVMAQRDARDPLWCNAENSGRTRNTPWTIGVAVNPFDAPMDASLCVAMDKAIEAMRAAGMKVGEVCVPHATDIARLWGDLLATEVHHLMGTTLQTMASPKSLSAIESMLGLSRQLDTHGLLEGLSKRLTFERAWGLMFEDIDALVMPTSLRAPFDNDLDFQGTQHMADILSAQQPLVAINLLGLPAVAIPTHLAHGLPVGVQVIAPMHDDFFALEVAQTLEQHLGTLWQHLPLNQA